MYIVLNFDYFFMCVLGFCWGIIIDIVCNEGVVFGDIGNFLVYN